MSKRVQWTYCSVCGKCGFHDQHDAEKALGRARAKRDRIFAGAASRRGMRRENRYYDCENGLYHLTSQSRRNFNKLTGSVL